jgi:AcrR family transcriptional regulator
MINLKKAPEKTEDKNTARRQAIIDAALDCFLQYGFAKTSLDDIAKRAKLSRPLLYLLFKNKEELFVETLRAIYQAELDSARPVLDLPLSKKEKLMQLCEELLLKPRTYIFNSPSGAEFIEQCHKYFPQLDEEYEKEAFKLLLPILEDKATAEVFMLCMDGLYADDPSPAVLRKRVRLFIERFV